MTLIDKLRAADGPDRELDAEIALLLTKPDGESAYWSMPPREGPEACAPGTLWRKNRGFRSILEDAPLYTASIDAALALVADKLPGWKWSINRLDYGHTAFVRPPLKTQGDLEMQDMGEGGAHQTSPAIAILIALLSALEGESA